MFHQSKSLPDSSQSLIELSSNGVMKKFNCWGLFDGLARISQMLNVRRIEDDLTGDIDEDEIISLGESNRLVRVICIDDEGEDVDGFVCNMSSLIRRDSMIYRGKENVQHHIKKRNQRERREHFFLIR